MTMLTILMAALSKTQITIEMEMTPLGINDNDDNDDNDDDKPTTNRQR